VSLGLSADATFVTGGVVDVTQFASKVNDRMQARYLPWYYAPGAHTRRISQIVALEIQSLRDAVVDAVNQTYARSSTWTMSQQEAAYGLPPEPSTPIEQRQDRLVSAMRQLGTADLKNIRDICQSYVFGDVDVIPDFLNYTLVVQFKSQQGIPANLADLQAQVRTRVPPPYDIQYWTRYTRYGEIKQAARTYGALKSLGLTYGAIKLWRPS
jgi:hypothetical protein